EKLHQWAKHKYQRPILALSIRWVLDKEVSVALWGARKKEQLDELETVWGWTLKRQDFDEIDKIIQETILKPVGPEFMAPPAQS
ncbi:MAG: aldo/keto reductase, partial [Anaerolineae bacterium]